MNEIPDHLSNDIFYLVRNCIWAGVSPENFIKCAQQCWEDALRDEIKAANRKFDKPAL